MKQNRKKREEMKRGFCIDKYSVNLMIRSDTKKRKSCTL